MDQEGKSDNKITTYWPLESNQMKKKKITEKLTRYPSYQLSILEHELNIFYL